MMALASLLTYVPETNSFFFSWLGKVTGISDQKELTTSIPFALLQSVFLAVVFYLMVNLFHRALNVLRNYRYLDAIEKEIRTALKINDDINHAFTREGRFYWCNRPWILGTVKYVYVVFLGGLLSTLFGGRFYYDWRNWILVVVDICFAIPTLGYFLAFSYYSIGLEGRKNGSGKKRTHETS
jgi:Ca2+/Na+ antiporter